jgi:hypothetical protein
MYALIPVHISPATAKFKAPSLPGFDLPQVHFTPTIAAGRCRGLCDDNNLSLTNDNSMFKQQALNSTFGLKFSFMIISSYPLSFE